MLGQIAEEMPGHRRPGAEAATRHTPGTPRCARLLARLSAGAKLPGRDVRPLYPGEVPGVVASEGQGQDELFDVLAGRTP